MALRLRGEVQLPAHTGPGGFDHGDVHGPTGLVYVAHTANGSVEVIEGDRMEHVATIQNCPEASGVLYAPSHDLVFAAARSAGKILVIRGGDRVDASVRTVAGRPNGLAWDSSRGHLLVADVGADSVSILAPDQSAVLATGALPGRPRWTGYDPRQDRFLVNIREPAMVALVDPETARVQATWPVPVAGPHGLDLDIARGLAYVACDGAEVVALDLESGRPAARLAIAGEPDAIWFNPRADRLYVAIGHPGVLQSVDVGRMVIAETLSTGQGAKTIALDVDRQTLFVFKPSTCAAAAYEEA